MLCDKCGKKPATVHYKQVINGVAQEQHLCEDCAGGGLSFGTLDLNKLFSAAQPRREGLTCPNCGMHFAEFKQSGRLGCSECYAAFAEAIRPVVRRYHGDRRHIGKLKKPLQNPAADGQAFKPADVLASKSYERLALQKQMAELVEAERFEEAAQVRDKLRALEAELAKAGDCK